MKQHNFYFLTLLFFSLISGCSNKTYKENLTTEKSKTPETWEDGWFDELTLHLQVQQDLMKGKKLFEYHIISKRQTSISKICNIVF